MAIDPRFQDQARTFITETLKQVVPTLNVDSGSAINSVFGRGGATITAVLFQEIEHVLTTRDLSDPTALSEADMDLILSNLLTARDGGQLSFGLVRLYYNERQRREFGAGLTATISTSEINFVTLSDLVFEPQDYAIDSDNGLYYINVPMVGEESGEAYNVDPGDINQLVSDLSGAVLVTNPSAFRNGLEAQDNTQALRKAQRSVSTRTPLSTDGAVFWFQETFGGKLRDLLVVGNGDDEMLRDKLWDMGAGADPRYAIGVASLDEDNAQDGTSMDVHVGGRTDYYLLFDAINYVQQHVDIFADMVLDANTLAGATVINATFVTGTTGQISDDGRLILALGGSGQETVEYTSVTGGPNSYTFTLAAPTTVDHTGGDTVKAVNNQTLNVGEDSDIDILPVFQISEIRLLDPITYEPIGDPVPETTESGETPGWYVAQTNPYDLLSGRETKVIVLDEKRLVAGNQPLSGSGTVANANIAGTDYWRLTTAETMTGYQGRDVSITYSGTTTTRTIIMVEDANNVIVSGPALGPDTVTFEIAAGYGDYIQYPVRVSFYTNTEIAEAQQFLDQDKKRPVAGDGQARAFLPVFIDFTMNYRGDGEAVDIRDRVNEVLKTSAGEAIGESEGAKFDYSDLVAAAYEDGLANYVQTPFQVRVRRLQTDGSYIVNYLNPDDDTVGNLAVKVANPIGGTFLETKRPTSVSEFTPPDQGKLLLGGFTANQQEVEYTAVVRNDPDYLFVLAEGTTITATHAVDEPLRVAASDYEDDNVITDGVITDERTHRPFLGQVVIEKL
jgi:hypothetical protein